MKEKKRNNDFDKIMIEALQGDFSFYAWQSVGGVLEKCELKMKAYRRDHSEMEFEPHEGQGFKLANIVSGNRAFNIYIPELSISFSSGIKEIMEDKRIKVDLPKGYFFHERRKHERIQPSKTCYVSFEYNNVLTKKAIYDVCQGGVSVVLPKSGKIVLEKGKIYNEFILEVGTRKIKVKAECVKSFWINRFKFENMPYGGFKLAFRFIEMKNEDREFWNNYITNEMLLKCVKVS